MTKALQLDLQVLQQLTGVGVVQTDMATGRFVQANPAFCELVGYSEAELQTMTYLELTHPEDRERDAENFAALQQRERQGGSSLSRVLHKDGTVVWLELHVSVIGEGSQALNLAVVNDVSERKRIETDLRASEAQLRHWEERYRIALEAAELATWDWDVVADRVVWNERHYHLLGLEPRPEEETAASFLRFLHPEDAARVERALERALSEGVYRADFRVVRAGDAAVRWMSSYGRVVEWQGERATRMTGVMFDVTARNQVEAERERLLAELAALNETLEQRVLERTEALERSQVRFRQAFHAGPVAACITTLGKETFVEVNGAFLALTGYTEGEVLGKDAAELGMWSSPGDQRKLTAAADDATGLRNLELQVKTKEGAVRDVLLSSEMIRLDGEHGHLRLFYDVTERKRSEEELYDAIQQVMSDTAWFSQQVMERLAHIRTGNPDAPPSVELTQRERQVLTQIAQGKNNDAIARELGLAPQTVRNYISVLYDKLGVRSRAEAVVWARERGIS